MKFKYKMYIDIIVILIGVLKFQYATMKILAKESELKEYKDYIDDCEKRMFEEAKKLDKG